MSIGGQNESEQKVYRLTPEGYAKNKERLEYLLKVKRKEIADYIHEAKEAGDISESSAQCLVPFAPTVRPTTTGSGSFVLTLPPALKARPSADGSSATDHLHSDYYQPHVAAPTTARDSSSPAAQALTAPPAVRASSSVQYLGAPQVAIGSSRAREVLRDGSNEEETEMDAVAITDL